MVDTAFARRDLYLREIAEDVWVNCYVMAYVRALMVFPTAPLSRIGWTSVITANTDDALTSYGRISAYSVEPDLLYQGWAHATLSRDESTFTSDLWAAAILLVQRFKDLPEAPELREWDLTLPIYNPSGTNPIDRFPLACAHPVAWFWLFADALYNANLTTLPHAGLTTAYPAYWVDRRRMDAAVDHFNAAISHSGASRRWRFAPTLFRSVMDMPAKLHPRLEGGANLGARWGRVVDLWFEPHE